MLDQAMLTKLVAQILINLVYNLQCQTVILTCIVHFSCCKNRVHTVDNNNMTVHGWCT